ncbi:MAG: hypothetical protein E7600_03935 [Ruminococcaceae bacterium]|nr:hypothetical protein [Oscillospiraceae bacterium]
MLYDLEKTRAKIEEIHKSDEYKKLVYDLESFIIDYCYPIQDDYDFSETEKSDFIGKINLRNRIAEDGERGFVFTKLRPVLISLQIPESVKGFRLLEMLVLECVRITLSQGSYKMKDVYPVVAKKFGINAHNCERLCRYACTFAKPTANFALKYPSLEELTHRTVEDVTVKELVDILVWYLICECNFKRKTYTS